MSNFMNKIKKDLMQYIEKNIIVQYKNFDGGHDTKHVKSVIENSMRLAKKYDVDVNMVYAIAAYHDVGLIKGRTGHEKNSGIYLLNDEKLKKWFDDEKINTMKEAVEDHRASNDYEPRTIYGKIIADADRNLDILNILERSYKYGVEIFPNYTLDDHFERVYDHIKDKYGKNGYMKLWLNDSVDKNGLCQIWYYIDNKDEMRRLFKTIDKN